MNKCNCPNCPFKGPLELYNKVKEPENKPIYYLEKTKEFFDDYTFRQVYFVACKRALRKWHPKLAPILDGPPPLYAEKLKSTVDIDELISKLKSEGLNETK